MSNFKLASFNAGLQMLVKAFAQKQAVARENKAQRQARRRKHMAGWGCSGSGERECARRRQQMAYDAGVAFRRALIQ